MTVPALDPHAQYKLEQDHVLVDVKKKNKKETRSSEGEDCLLSLAPLYSARIQPTLLHLRPVVAHRHTGSRLLRMGSSCADTSGAGAVLFAVSRIFCAGSTIGNFRVCIARGTLLHEAHTAGVLRAHRMRIQSPQSPQTKCLCKAHQCSSTKHI